MSIFEIREEYERQKKEHEKAAIALGVQLIHLEALIKYSSNDEITPIDASIIESPKSQLLEAAPESIDDKTPPSNALKVLPEFEGMTQIDAFSVIFEQNAGKALHLSYLVEAYYGRVSSLVMAKGKSRIATIMKTGVQRKLWQKVPKSVGYYTLDRKLLDD